MLLSSSEVLDPSNEGDTKPLTVHQFQVSPDFLLSVKKKQFQKLILPFSHTGQRTGLFSTGTEHELGFKVTKTSYCCSNTTAQASLLSTWTRYLSLYTEDEK